MSSLSTLPKGDSAWLLRKAIERIMQQISVLETNIGSSTTGNSNDTEIIFNDAGTLRGDKDFAWNKTSNILTIDGSATITGNLTVDTSTLKVDSSNHRVGINTASPTQVLDVAGNISANAWLGRSNISVPVGDCSIFRSADNTLAFGIASSTAMTLNSTGLGVGGSPTTRFEVFSGFIKNTATTGSAQIIASNTGGVFTLAKDSSTGGNFTGTAYASVLYSDGAYPVCIFSNGSERLRIDSSGNVGVGVTPSAGGTGFYKTFEIGKAGCGLFVSTAGLSSAENTYFSGNAVLKYNSGAEWSYGNNGEAGIYGIENGVHKWFNAASGTAGGVFTPTTAMVLDGSGNLLVGTTAPLSGNAAKFHLSTDSGTTRWAVGPYSSATNFIISAVGGSGVYLNGTAATSWTSASDERLKDIIEPITNAVSKVASLRAVIGKFKFDENNTRKPFLIAQDVQAVLPEAVDASNPDRLGVAYTDVIPLLVAAIKELTTRVQTLEAK